MSVSAVIVTKDEDFARRKKSGIGPAVVWIRLPNTRRDELLAWFGTVLPDIIAALNEGDTLIEVT